MDTLFPQKLLSELEVSALAAKSLHIVGTSSLVAVASLLTSKNFYLRNERPILIITPNDEASSSLEVALRFFDPNSNPIRLEGFDVSPYSGLHPNYLLLSKRLHFLYRAQYALKGDIFISSVTALSQKTLSQNIFEKFSFHLKIGSRFSKELINSIFKQGYQSAPRVEDVGQICIKGGLVDIFSPSHPSPIRIELFDETIDTLRFFDPATQKTLRFTDHATIIPCREVIYHDLSQEFVLKKMNALYSSQSFTKSFREQFYENISQKKYFHGIDFLFPYFYENAASVFDFFTSAPAIVKISPLDITTQLDQHLEGLKKEFNPENENFHVPFVDQLYENSALSATARLAFSDIELFEDSSTSHIARFRTSDVFFKPAHHSEHLVDLKNKISHFLEKNYFIFVSVRTHSQSERVGAILDRLDLKYSHVEFDSVFDLDSFEKGTVYILQRPLPESVALDDESILFLRDEDFFGEKNRSSKKQPSLASNMDSFLLSDLKVGERVVHSDFGVAVFEGLKTMEIGGVPSELIQLKYSGDDRLYVPVYRINIIKKYSGSLGLDKLGTNKWEKTKVKIKNQLKDIAADLLNLYARRSVLSRSPPDAKEDLDFQSFEGQFAYDETEDQLSAIHAILNDLKNEKPMDRLICGDVGFGKTEVAMRAAFKMIQNKKQVCVLVPTTILSFQHFDTFKKRFKDWPVQIGLLSRFTSKKQSLEYIQKLKTGELDIIIGTHRLLSKDIQFKNLGLLIVDEEHKFGVTHKEKIKLLKSNVDCISLSATPIPRTLNMSLVGIRDLSLISTPPKDRLPIRTFICRFEEDLIKKAVETEISRGGQVYFLHNRVGTIGEFSEKIQKLIPSAKIKFAHGQMPEDTLEKVMISFFNKEFDVLISTTIIESGVDIPSANTILIDRADTFGLSQLYQLRGRVGRSNERAYCYLLIPASGNIDSEAQERLKVLQENSELGSGLKIAHHDLELRGAGNLLGEEQSGHANSVGYELYVELLEQAVREAKGEDISRDVLEPEINIRIPALIPSDYIPDIRMRLSYYNEFSKISSHEDIHRFEEELSDQFGKIPQSVQNLMGVMLLKTMCKSLSIQELSAGTKNLSLSFTAQTSLKNEIIIELITGRPKKYSLTPDSRLIISLHDLSWSSIYEELAGLLDLIKS